MSEGEMDNFFQKPYTEIPRTISADRSAITEHFQKKISECAPRVFNFFATRHRFAYESSQERYFKNSSAKTNERTIRLRSIASNYGERRRRTIIVEN